MTYFRTKKQKVGVYLTFKQYKLSNSDENQNYLKIIKSPLQL